MTPVRILKVTWCPTGITLTDALQLPYFTSDIIHCLYLAHVTPFRGVTKGQTGLENRMENGTENGMENGTENETENEMENGTENEMDNGIEDGTENRMENGMETLSASL